MKNNILQNVLCFGKCVYITCILPEKTFTRKGYELGNFDFSMLLQNDSRVIHSNVHTYIYKMLGVDTR